MVQQWQLKLKKMQSIKLFALHHLCILTFSSIMYIVVDSGKIWLYGLSWILVLCSEDIVPTSKFSDISLQYDATFDGGYATTMWIACSNKVSSMYQGDINPLTDAIGIIYISNMFVCSLQGLMLLILDKRDDFCNKNEEFYNCSIKKVLSQRIAYVISVL